MSIQEEENKIAKKAKTNRKPKEKVLDISIIDKELKEIEKWHKHVVDEEKNIVIKYKKVFGQFEIEKVISELHDHLIYDIGIGKKYFTDDESFYVYMYFLIIKHFSHFSEQFKDSTMETNLVLIEKLGETGYFKLFFDEIFESEEVLKVIKAVNEKAELLDKMNDLNKEIFEKLNQLPSKSKIDELLEQAKKLQN